MCDLVVLVEGSVADGVMGMVGSVVKVVLTVMGMLKLPDGSVGSGTVRNVVLSEVMVGMRVSVGSTDEASSSSCGRGFGAAAAKTA